MIGTEPLNEVEDKAEFCMPSSNLSADQAEGTGGGGGHGEEGTGEGG